MQQIKPETFAQLMQLPVTLRSDLLEFIGSTPVADVEILSLIQRLSDGHGVSRAA